ncbi:MAG: NUDIX domain-containing protein [Parachlamydiaceae bacterium]
MTTLYTVYSSCPAHFVDPIECAGCYCRFEETFLLLRRHPEKPLGDTWGIPGGKLDAGETPHQAMLRELYEEVGIEIDASLPQHFCTLYVEVPHLSTQYSFHIFYARFDMLPELRLHLNEHLESRWVTPEEGGLLPLISGGQESLQAYLAFIRYGR